MNFKNTFILFLCSNSIILATDNTLELKEQLVDELIRKQEELTVIGNKVTEQEELIAKIKAKINSFELEYVNQKMKAPKKDTDISENKLEDAFITEIVEEVAAFRTAYFKDGFIEKNKTKGMLISDFLKNKKEDNNLLRSLIKFYSIRCIYEEASLIRLVTMWEFCANIVNDLTNQIESF